MSHQTFSSTKTQVSETIVKYSFPYTQAQVIKWWSEPNVGWICYLLLILESSPFREYRLEVKPFQKGHLETTNFEFVLVKDFFIKTYQGQFDGYFEEGLDQGEDVVTFSGREEGLTLIVPTPIENFPANPKKTFGSPELQTKRQLERQAMETIGPFVRSVYLEAWEDRKVKRGDQALQWKWIEMWRRVGVELKRQLATNGTVWVSTHGHGVAWLHLRVEASPRYISYEPYVLKK